MAICCEHCNEPLPSIIRLHGCVNLVEEKCRIKYLCWPTVKYPGMLCFVDRVSLYNLVNKANLVQNFSQ